MAAESLFFVLLGLSLASHAWASGAERIWRRLGNDLTEETGVGAHHERFIIDGGGHVLAAFLHGKKSYLAVPATEGWQSLELPFTSPAYDAELAGDGSIKALGRDEATGAVWLGQYDQTKKRWSILVKTVDVLTPARNADTVIGKIAPRGNGFFVLYPSNAGKDEWSVVKFEGGRLVAVGSPLRIGLSESVQLHLNRSGQPVVSWALRGVAAAAELSSGKWRVWNSPVQEKTYRSYLSILPSGRIQVAYFHDDAQRNAQALSLFEGATVPELESVWASPSLNGVNSFADVFVSREGNAFVLPCRSSLSKPGEPLRLYSAPRGGKWRVLPNLPMEDCSHRATLASRLGEPLLLVNDNSRLSVMALQAPAPNRVDEKAVSARIFFVSPEKSKQVKVHFAEFWGMKKVDRKNLPRSLQILGSAGLTEGKLQSVESVSEQGVKLWYGHYLLERAVGEPAAAIFSVGKAAKLERLNLAFQAVDERRKVPLLRKLISGLSKTGNENEGKKVPYSIGVVDGAETLLDRDGKPLCKLANCVLKQGGEIYLLSWREGEYATDFIYRNAVSGIFESRASFDYQLELGGKPAIVFTGCLPGEGCRIMLWYELNGKIEKAVATENIVIP